MMLKLAVSLPTLIYNVVMQKLRHKTVVNTSLIFQKFLGLAGVDFGSVKFQLTFLFRIFVVLLQLHSNS